MKLILFRLGSAFLSILLVVLIFVAGGIFYVYQAHPAFKHPFHYAVACMPNTKLLSRLLDRWGSAVLSAPGKDGGTALHYAAFYNSNSKVTHWLIKKGAKVNALDKQGKSPLYYAIKPFLKSGCLGMGNMVKPFLFWVKKENKLLTKQYKDHLKKIKVLLKNKANVNLELAKGDTLLHYIMSVSDNVEVLQLALKYGANLNARNKKGDSVLHSAVANNTNIKLLKWLLNQIKRVDIVNDNGLTLLHKASA